MCKGQFVLGVALNVAGMNISLAALTVINPYHSEIHPMAPPITNMSVMNPMHAITPESIRNPVTSNGRTARIINAGLLHRKERPLSRLISSEFAKTVVNGGDISYGSNPDISHVSPVPRLSIVGPVNINLPGPFSAPPRVIQHRLLSIQDMPAPSAYYLGLMGFLLTRHFARWIT